MLAPLQTKKYAHLTDADDDALLAFIQRMLSAVCYTIERELQKPTMQTKPTNLLGMAAGRIDKLLQDARRKANERRKLERDGSSPRLDSAGREGSAETTRNLGSELAIKEGNSTVDRGEKTIDDLTQAGSTHRCYAATGDRKKGGFMVVVNCKQPEIIYQKVFKKDTMTRSLLEGLGFNYEQMVQSTLMGSLPARQAASSSAKAASEINMVNHATDRTMQAQKTQRMI